MTEPTAQEDKIQSLADVLSLLAIVGQLDKAAVQRVLIALGASLMDVEPTHRFDSDLTRKLIIQIAAEAGEEAALHTLSDMDFVARAWRPVLDQYLPSDPYRLLPYAEMVYALVNHTGMILYEYDAFERFGGADEVLPMRQLTASLQTYPVPVSGLTWDLIGFHAPPDQALIGTSDDAIYLFKAASSGIDVRLSELERGSDTEARREHDVRVDRPLFAAFIAGLLGDMIYWAARLRSHATPGQDIWLRMHKLLTETSLDDTANKPASR